MYMSQYQCVLTLLLGIIIVKGGKVITYCKCKLSDRCVHELYYVCVIFSLVSISEAVGILVS